MDISKLKFDISVTYDCDEGEGCDRYLENGTYEEAVELFSDLKSRTWIDHYYHFMAINEFGVYDENGNALDFDKILDGEYSWIPDYCTSNKSEASDTPAACLEFLEDLKIGPEGKKAREISELKKRIKELEEELADAKKELEEMENKKNGEKV